MRVPCGRMHSQPAGTMTDIRQDPDALLAKVQREEAQTGRGRLKIFFGASAGVGKTYAMLSAARELRAQTVDVVVGIVETHGRKDTAALLEGLEVLPARFVEYRGTRLAEFDLDGALARRPAVILVDELAHNNAAGSRHPKRCQDVDELLSAGIDVYTTVNVQHLESLNDVIGGITGIKVWETVPDQVFDRADEVTLVDLPPDELLQRLRQGKVYLPAQAERAVRNFFRKGNLIALRELALRRTADRVDDQMLAYRHDEAIRTVWHTRESLLACVGPEPGAEKLVRSTARLAKQLEVEWHAVYVETPKLQRLPEAQRERVLRVLTLAQELGAQTATIPGQSPTEEIVAYARSHNLARVVIGRGHRRRLPLARSFSDRIAALGTDLEVVQVGLGEGPAPRRAGSAADEDGGAMQGGLRAGYLWAAVTCALATLAALPLVPYLDLANIVMLFLLAVVLVAVRFGRGPAILAAFLSVGSFDFFFVPPRFTFAVSDVQYVVVFGVMLAVALIIGHLTSGLRYQARVSAHRETRARALYELARELSGVLVRDEVIRISDRHIEASFHAKTVILLPDANEKLRQPGADEVASAPAMDLAVAQWVFDNGKPAGFGTDTLPGTRVHYAPLPSPMRTRGVLALEPEMARLLLIPGAAPVAGDVRSADRDCAGARALHRGCAGRAGENGVRTPAQFHPERAFARSAHAAHRAARPGRVAGADQARIERRTAGVGCGDPRRGSADECAGEQPARHGAARGRRSSAQPPVATAGGSGRQRRSRHASICSLRTLSASICPRPCRWSNSTRY